MTVSALFWDYDNTLLETALAHWNKHVHVLARLGITLEESYRQRVYENNGNQNWQWMCQELGLKLSQEEYLKAVDEEFKQYIDLLEMRPGVQEALSLAKSLKIPQAIITNARRNSASPVIDSKGISSYMQFILFKEDYSERKPSPIPYLKGLERMQLLLKHPLEARDCIAIEDDPKGVEAAHRAGLCVIQRTLSPNEPPSPFANHVCFDKDVFLALIQKLLKS